MEKPNPASFKQLTISVQKLPASTGQSAMSEYATQRARLLLGCYRTGEANDPETYVAAIAATLARFPEDIITSVTHPVTGLPSRSTWLPTVKEVRSACDEIYDRQIQHAERERRIQRQFAEREEYDRIVRPTYEQLKAKYGENWGLTEATKKTGQPPQPAPNIDQLRHHYEHYGLSFMPKETA